MARINVNMLDSIDYSYGKVVEIAIRDIAIDNRIPVAILAVYDPISKTFGSDVGYLSPFRGYSFQVSATMKGEGDCGCTPVIGLKNISKAVKPKSDSIYGYSSNLGWDTTKKLLLRSLALYAINEFCDSRHTDDNDNWYRFAYHELPVKSGEDLKVRRTLSDGRLTNEWYPEMIDLFIYETMKWIDKNLYLNTTSDPINK